MRPDHQKRDRLPGAGKRIDDPEAAHDRAVVDDDAVERLRQAGRHDMLDDEEGDQQAEYDLGGFARRHPQRPAQIDRAQHQDQVGDERAVEQDGTGGTAPEGGEGPQHPIGAVQRNQQDRVIYEVHRHEGQHDEAGRQAQLLQKPFGGEQRRNGLVHCRSRGLPAIK
jgi:hypothetical protein